jgi:hypothetical protein
MERFFDSLTMIATRGQYVGAIGLGKWSPEIEILLLHTKINGPNDHFTNEPEQRLKVHNAHATTDNH